MYHFAFRGHGHLWDGLVSDLHENCSPLHFQLPLKSSLSLKKNVESYRVPVEGVVSVH